MEVHVNKKVEICPQRYYKVTFECLPMACIGVTRWLQCTDGETGRLH